MFNTKHFFEENTYNRDNEISSRRHSLSAFVVAETEVAAAVLR